MPDQGSTTADTQATDANAGGGSEAVTAEEQKWFTELNEGKSPAEQAKFDKLWKDMNHKDRKDFYDEIQKVKQSGGAGSSTSQGSTADPVSPDEEKWLTELNKDKSSEDQAKFEKMWKDMNHKDRKDFFEEIQKIKKPTN